jgi:hypothetical protein
MKITTAKTRRNVATLMHHLETLTKRDRYLSTLSNLSQHGPQHQCHQNQNDKAKSVLMTEKLPPRPPVAIVIRTETPKRIVTSSHQPSPKTPTTAPPPKPKR